jgi:hypothetical protein
MINLRVSNLQVVVSHLCVSHVVVVQNTKLSLISSTTKHASYYSSACCHFLILLLFYIPGILEFAGKIEGPKSRVQC